MVLRKRGQSLFFGGALLILIAYAVCCSLGRTTHGFIAYYAASRLLVSGALGPAAYDDAWFTRYVQDITSSGVIEVFRPNPPTMALVAMPVVLLSPLQARAIWVMASLFAFALASMALRKRCLAPYPLLLLLLNPAVFANLRTGQAYLFVFAALTAVALALARGRDLRAGVILGFTLALKTSGLPLLLLLIVRQRFRAVVAALVVAAALALVVTPFLGAETWQRYPGEVWTFLERPAASATGYQTTRSLFRRLCLADPAWNPQPAADCPQVAQVAPVLVSLTAVLLTIVAAQRARTDLWIAAGVCLSVLVLPVAAEPHFVLLGLVVMWLIRAGPSDPGEAAPIPIWGWLAFAGLFLVPLDFTAIRFTNGWSALAAYPRVYAAWLLWGLTILAMFREESHGRVGLQSDVPDGR